jgi:hypothetical protein
VPARVTRKKVPMSIAPELADWLDEYRARNDEGLRSRAAVAEAAIRFFREHRRAEAAAAVLSRPRPARV